MSRAKDINEYIAAAPATHRPALKKLRAQMKKFYPKAVEHISYGMPLFKLDGHPLGSFRAAKNHIGLFVWSGTVISKLGTILKGYDTAKGTVRYAPEKPLPDSVVKALLAQRAKEIKARWPNKK